MLPSDPLESQKFCDREMSFSVSLYNFSDSQFSIEFLASNSLAQRFENSQKKAYRYTLHQVVNLSAYPACGIGSRSWVSTSKKMPRRHKAPQTGRYRAADQLFNIPNSLPSISFSLFCKSILLMSILSVPSSIPQTSPCGPLK